MRFFLSCSHSHVGIYNDPTISLSKIGISTESIFHICGLSRVLIHQKLSKQNKMDPIWPSSKIHKPEEQGGSGSHFEKST